MPKPSNIFLEANFIPIPKKFEIYSELLEDGTKNF